MIDAVAIKVGRFVRPSRRPHGGKATVLAYFDCELTDVGVSLRGCALAQADDGVTVWAPTAKCAARGSGVTVHPQLRERIAALALDAFERATTGGVSNV